MSENKFQLNDVTKLEGLSNINVSDGFVCDLETGICGPVNAVQHVKAENKDEEKKNENNDMV